MREYFEAEMRKLKTEAGAFAEQCPEQARELNIARDQDRDPYIERLLEASAFLTAQIHQRIDDDLPDICESLLQQLAPQLISPYPAATVMEFNPRQGMLQQSYQLPQGARMRSRPVGEEHTACEFVTTKSMVLNPLRLTKTHIKQADNGGSEITLRLQADPGIALENCDLSDMVFYLNADFSVASHLFMAMTHQVRGLKIIFSEIDQQQNLTPTITPAHLDLATSMLPGSGRHFKGYHLLLDYFAFIEKYLFIRIENLNQIIWPKQTQQFELILHVDAIFPPEYHLSKDNFKLHCVPAINLFQSTVEPVQLTHKLAEYPLIVDSKARASKQLYALERLTGTNKKTGETYQYSSMQSFLQREKSSRVYKFI